MLFGLIGRDVAGELPHVLRNIERLASQPVFRSAHVLLVENDSADNTTGVMADWAARAAAASGGRVTGAVHSLPPQHSSKKTLGILAKARRRRRAGRPRPACATLRLALHTTLSVARPSPSLAPRSLARSPTPPQVRNVYLDEARAGDYRLLIAVDTDMCTPWDVAQQAQVLSNLLPGRGSDWHVASANGVCGWYADDSHIPGGAAPHAAVKAPINSRAPGVRPIYCDLFALHTLTRRPDGWNVLLPPGQCEAVPSRAWQPECSRLAGEAAFQVRAAFGGLTVYDVPFLRGPGAKCAYASNHMGGGCEHTPLNFCLNDAGARLFVVTRLVVNWEGCEGPVLDAVPAGRT